MCETVDAGRLREAAVKKKDEDILMLIRGKDCVAIEAQYHRKCYYSYINFLFKKEEDTSTREIYKVSFNRFCDDIVEDRILQQNGIMYFTDLFKLFVEMVMNVEQIDASNYNKSRLKSRLINKFPQLMFHTCGGRNKGEIVLKENLSAKDLLGKKLEKINAPDSEDDMELEAMPTDVKGNVLQNLYSAALEIKSLLQKCTGLQTDWPPLSMDITLEASLDVVPVNLFNFLAWSLGLSEDPCLDKHVFVEQKHARKILSIAQDMVYLSSNGRKQTPKSIALGMATRQISGSTKMVSLLNGLGHSVSLHVVNAHETALAKLNLSEDVSIPKGVYQDQFTTLVWDNIDFGEETRSGGGTTHVANGIIIQTVDGEDSSLIPATTTQSNVTSKSERSLPAPPKDIVHYVLGKRESPKLKEACQSLNLRDTKGHQLENNLFDLAYALCKVFGSDGGVLMPGWTGFNSELHANDILLKSTIGYLPIVDAPVTDLSTVYTILKRSMKIADKLKLQYLVLVFDEAIYSKVQQIRCKTPEFAERFAVRLGDFHATMSFLSTIGKRFREAGLEV